MSRKTKKKILLLSAISCFCLAMFILGLLFKIPIPKNRDTTALTQRVCKKEGILTICDRIADVPNIPKLPLVRFGGSTTFAPLTPKAIAVINKTHRPFQLQHILPSSGQAPSSAWGIKTLIEGTHQLSFTQSSRPIGEEEIKKANDRHITLKDIPVAHNILVVYVNPKLVRQGLQGLTFAQVQGIFAGGIRNWRDVGGPDLEIVVFQRDSGDKAASDLYKRLGIEFGPHVRAVGKGKPEKQITTQVIREVGNNPGGISFSTIAKINQQKDVHILPLAKKENRPFVSPCADDKCTRINKKVIVEESNYPSEFKNRLFVVIKQDGGLDEQAGIAYANMLLSNEGQRLVEEAGFVRYRE